MDYSSYITEGRGRCDLSLLLRDPKVFANVIEEMTQPFVSSSVDAVAALDALGFVFGTAVAQKLGVGLILVRKEGKISVERDSLRFTDYSGTEKGFEITKGVVKAGQRILVVDEWSETGAQLRAAAILLERVGAMVVGISCFNIDKPVLSDQELQKYKLHSVNKSL